MHTPRRTSMSPDQHGFILFAVLVAVVAISMLAVSLSRRAGADAGSLAVEADMILADTAADAGVVRIIAALGNLEDPLARRLSPYNDAIRWMFGGLSVDLRVRAESGKVDILAGDRQLIERVVGKAITDPELASAVLARIDEIRQKRILPDTLAAILPPAARLSAQAYALDQHLTVFSAQSGIDPLAASAIVRDSLIELRPQLKAAMAESLQLGYLTTALTEGLGSAIAQQRPLYSIEAQAILPNGIVARRGALVSTAGNGGDVRVERRYELAPTQSF